MYSFEAWNRELQLLACSRSVKKHHAVQLIDPQGQILITGQSGASKLHFVAYTELYRYPRVSVLPGNVVRSRRHR